MNKRFFVPPRSTLHLSAGLLLLPAAALAQPDAGWQCRAENGRWQCDPAPTAAAAPQTARKPLPTAVAAASGDAADNAWDYVELKPGENPPAGVCCSPRSGCNGYYREPVPDWQDSSRKPAGQPMRANAAESEWQGDKIRLNGAIVVTQGNTKLTAAGGELNRATHVARLHGNVVLRQPGIRITGSAAELNTQTSDGRIGDARFLDYRNGIRATASSLRRKGENVLELNHAQYTTCPPDSETWHLKASHVHLDREAGRGVARNAVLDIGPVPVFYSPYLDFPLDDRRKSGFLWPTLSNTASGIDITAPYYLNLAPNYDATIAPRFVTNRGSMVEVEGRYLNRYSNWVVTGSDLPDDRQTGTNRWLSSIKEGGSLDSHWSTSIDYTKVSDDDYFHDLGLSSLTLRRTTNLAQQANLGFRYDRWFAQATVQQFQNIDPFVADSYRKLPQLTFGRNADARNFTLDYSLLGEATRFDHPDSISSGGTFVTGERYYAEPGLVFPMRWAAGYVQPEVRLRHVSYSLDEPVPGSTTGDTHPSTTQFQGIVDSGLNFERETRFGNTDYQQTLEPRLYYVYSPYKGQNDQPNFDSSPLTFNYQQLFQPRRFTGHDRLEDFNQLSAGVTSRFIEDATGRESFSASIGQIFYFSDRKITTVATTATGGSQTVQTQPNSALAGQLTWEPSDSLWTTANVLWDTDANQIQQDNVYVHYATVAGLYNFGYRHSRADPLLSTLSQAIDQVDASTVFPVSNRWRLFARFNYELNDHNAIENLIGAEYEDCCWVARLVYQKAVTGERLNNAGVVEPRLDEIIMLEFQLKGLGSMGQGTEQTLKESIWGFR